MAGIQRDIAVTRKGDQCLVTPGSQIAAKGGPDRVKWHNFTGDYIVVIVKDGIFTAPGTIATKVIEDKKSGDLDVQAGAQQGNVPYAVYCAATANLAVGNSDPEIIIV